MSTLIFDGNNTFFRNFAASPLADANGNPIGGVIGCIRSVKWILRESGANRVFWVWDAAGGSKKRKSILSEYKAGRNPRMNREVDENTTDAQQNLIWQMDKTASLLKLLGVTQLTIQDIEADDAIAYLVGLLEPTPKVIVSADKDMWQLVSPTTTVYWPTKKVYLTPGNMKEFTPFHHENYVLARALAMGDSSDNIAGLKGLGEKTLLKILPELQHYPTNLSKICEVARFRLELHNKGELELTASEKRWFPKILESQDLVKRNIDIMQLTSPIISAANASIINHAAQDMKPSFSLVNFKLALINSNIQLTDADLFTTFQEYKRRVDNEAA